MADIYSIEVRHDGLNKYRDIRGRDPHVVQQKALALEAQWEEMWERKQEKEARQRDRDNAAQARQSKKELAVQRTCEAEQAIDSLNKILVATLDVDDMINWDELKDTRTFSVQEPKEPAPPNIPREPQSTDPPFRPQIGLLGILIPPLKSRRVRHALERFSYKLNMWKRERDILIEASRISCIAFEKDIESWKKKRARFLDQQNSTNIAINDHNRRYKEGNADAIIDYCELVLSHSNYPDTFPQQFDLDYTLETFTLVIDYRLPAFEDISTLKQVKYIQARDEFTESHLKGAALTRLYDNIMYQITLRTIHELFEADVIKAIDSIVFNGFVESVDPATGRNIKPCIMTIQVSPEEFMPINLASVDPKACFRKLKGVGSSKLHSFTAVAPIISISHEDDRFIDGHDVVSNLDEGDNLAAMPWEDFEHLVRQVFEREFSQNGGEVKITRASRDGGVDAVAFDPDPIRGGKIVIQAKRYTNTVGVSAVRDLYGTVMNEGATKGILVTTSDYGPDAYGFAKDKPITLLSGSNLLHLLSKHGQRARIDLAEAKMLADE